MSETKTHPLADKAWHSGVCLQLKNGDTISIKFADVTKIDSRSVTLRDGQKIPLSQKFVAIVTSMLQTWLARDQPAPAPRPAKGVTKCGEDNSPWAFLVPGVTYVDDKPATQEEAELAELLSAIVN